MDELLGLIFVSVRLAIAVEPLTIATRAALDVAALHVKLPLYYSAVVARRTIRAPIIRLVSVRDAGDLSTIDDTCADFLSLPNAFRPVSRHRDAAIDDLFGIFTHDVFSNEA